MRLRALVPDSPSDAAPIEPATPAALLSWLASRGVCVAVGGDNLLPVDLRPVPDPAVPPDVVAAVRRRKDDLLEFLCANGQAAPRIVAIPPGEIADVIPALAGAGRVGVELAMTGSANPYRARAARLVLAIDPSTAFVVNTRVTNVLPLRDALAHVEMTAWGADCPRIGLMGLLLVMSNRPITALIPGAGLIVGDDDAAVAVAARRAAYAAAAGR
ncbi:MAG TPA: hypothetical protein VKD90_22235 [Gemmataceae bacterium]|nr:hypothetical protein [Gemmataceae bacterium]